MKKGKNNNVLFLSITSFFNDVSSEMIFSVMPLFMSGLGITKTWIGIIEGIAQSAASILKTISGWLSDRIQRRKPLILIGYTLSTIVKPFLALTNFWYQILVVRFFDRVGKGFRSSPRDALIAESVCEKDYSKAFGLHRAMDTAGAVVGALLASLLLYIFSNYFVMSQLTQYRNIFWLSVIPGVIAVLVLAIFVRDVKHKIDLKDAEKAVFSGFRRQYKFFLILSGIFELSKFSYVIFVLKAADLGVAIPMIPIIYLFYNLVYSVSARPIGHLADHIGLRKILMVGYALFCFTHLGFASASTPSQAWLFFAVYGVAIAILDVVPRALVAHFSLPEKRATAFGYYHTTVGLMALPATAIAGLLWDSFNSAAAFTYGAAISLSVLILFMLFVREPKKS